MKDKSELVFQPIGYVQSPYKDPRDMPIQPPGGSGIKGKIILNPELVDGLKSLDGFSHLILIYHFHKSEGYQLRVKPFLDAIEHGVFATRAPRRPNRIGISVVKLRGIQKNVLEIEDLDILDGTPLLDIKPYVPDFEQVENPNLGWLTDKLGEIRGKRSDDRFLKE